MSSKDGKLFQEDIEKSCEKLNIFYDRIKDQYIPPELRSKIPVVKNKYDCYIFGNQYLFPVELKSTQDNKLSLSESIVKDHQIKYLQWARKFKYTIPGFIVNFRSFNNRTFFIHIDDFVEYKEIAVNKPKEHKYKNKINKSSIPFLICEEIGLEIKYYLKRSRYHYCIDEFINEAVERWGLKNKL